MFWTPTLPNPSIPLRKPVLPVPAAVVLRVNTSSLSPVGRETVPADYILNPPPLDGSSRQSHCTVNQPQWEKHVLSDSLYTSGIFHASPSNPRYPTPFLSDAISPKRHFVHVSYPTAS